MAIKRLGAQRFSGLDADVPSLPIDADLVGAIFSSTDTLKFWIFNGSTWNESAGGGGITGINTNSTILDHSTTLTDYTSPASATATSSGTGGTLLSLTAGTTDVGLNASTVRGFGNIIDSSHPLVGQTVSSISIFLKNSMVGTGTVGVWDSGDNLVANFGTIDCSTLTGTYAQFDFTGSSRLIATDDRIGIFIDGANTGTNIQRNNSDVDSNLGGAPINSSQVWSVASSTQDMDMILQSAAGPENAIDEDTATFWKSNAGINESITVDMGSVVNDFALAFYIDKTQTGITETQFEIKTPAIISVDDTDLKAYWKFDELSGSIINVSSATASLGTAADLAITGDPTYDQTGSPSDLGNNLLFDGAGDFGKSGTSNSQFNFMHNSSAIFTICFWAKWTGAVVVNEKIIDNHDASDSTIGIDIRTRTTQNLRILISKGTVAEPVIQAETATNSIPTDNLFHFYCIRWDVSLGSNNLSFRRDDGNEELFTKTAFAPSDSDALKALYVAGNSTETGGEFPGNMLEMSIFNRILTSNEETDLFNNGDGRSISNISQPALTLRTVKVIDLVDQQYNFIRFNGVNAKKLVIEGSSGSSLVMAANDLQVLVESDPPLTTAHGQFTINGTNDTLALNGGDPTSSVIEDPQVNSITLNNVGTQGDPISGASVLWQQTQDANNDTTRIKMKINGAIEEVRFF